MEKHLFILCFIYSSFITLLSCTNQSEDTPDKTCYPICFELKKDLELTPFPVTKGIPAYKPSEPRSSSAENDSVLFTRIEYMVFDKASDTLVKHKILTEENSDDFGAYIYDELEAGVYWIALFAHSTSEMTLNDYCLSGTEISDSFFTAQEITVGAESSDTPVEAVLKRIVAKIKFCGTKEIPENAAKFILEVTGRYNELNTKTGNATSAQFLRKEYLLSGDSQNDDQPDYSFYTFLPEPAEGDTIFLDPIKLITLDSNNDTLHTILIPSVPVMRNRITRYTGSLYAPGTNASTISLEIEDQGMWKDSIDIQF